MVGCPKIGVWLEKMDDFDDFDDLCSSSCGSADNLGLKSATSCSYLQMDQNPLVPFCSHQNGLDIHAPNLMERH